MSALPEFKPEAFVDPALIQFAEKIVADVRAGKVAALGIVEVTAQGQIMTQTMGAHVPLYVGADIMKKNLMEAMAPSPAASRLLRPA